MSEFKHSQAQAALGRIRSAERSSRTARSRSERVAAAIKKIRAFHDLGQCLPPKRRHAEVYGEGLLRGAAERLHVNEDTLRKARSFADPGDGYASEEVDELCRLMQEMQPGQGERLAVFERTHVIRLLSVRQKRRRRALQVECIRRGWSTSELEREIAKRYGTRRAGGRRRAIPPDLTGLLTQLERMCEEWRRWQEELSRDPAELANRHVLMADLPGRLREQIKGAGKAITALHRDVAAELTRAQPDREARGTLRAGDEEPRVPVTRRERNG